MVSQSVYRNIQGITLSRRPQPIFAKSLFQQTSEQTIEVLDDDPKNFKLMLKFIYTMELPSPSCPDWWGIEAIAEQNIKVPIGVHILADKYEITPLLHPTCDQVEVAMRTHGGSLRANLIAEVVAAYYGACSHAQSTMGISTGNRQACWFLDPAQPDACKYYI